MFELRTTDTITCLVTNCSSLLVESCFESEVLNLDFEGFD